MNLKELMKKDLKVFFDLEAFAETVEVEGCNIDAILDDEELSKRQSGTKMAISEATALLFAKCEDLPKKREAGQSLNVKGWEYTIQEWTEAAGVATITLQRYP